MAWAYLVIAGLFEIGWPGLDPGAAGRAERLLRVVIIA